MIWTYELGAIRVHGIRDGGSTRDPLKYLVGSTAEALAPYADHFAPDGSMPNSFSCYLVEVGEERVMIDTGFGASAPDDMDVGHMPLALERLGVSPSDVAHVVFTHLHPDHILGSVRPDDSLFFDAARHWTVRREVDHWRRGTDERSKGITSIVDVIDGAGLLAPVDHPGTVIAGVEMVPTYGHTPGHVAIRIGNGSEVLVIAGDVTHSPVQIWHPEWGFPFDDDPEAAAATRRRFFDELAASGDQFVAGHYGQPGVGRIVDTADGRRYEPWNEPPTEPGAT